MRQIVLAGVGGQGILLASKILAKAALDAGYDVRTSETIGMAQRGGSVLSHLRIGDEGEEISSAMVYEQGADLLLGFEPGEALRALHLLSSEGIVAASNICIVPTTASGSGMDYSFAGVDAELARLQGEGAFARYLRVDAQSACEKCGSAKVLNTVMLGAAVKSGLVGFTASQVLAAMDSLIKPAFIELNHRAFEYGLA
ncbi:MAG: indolepyruvate oxidoreductase subunit beta [bacterium]|nr:indolepyruvate oxidoreductase subunit beta [bacterium]